MSRIDFEVSRQTPSLDHYRRDWVPGAGVGLAGMWLGAVVSDGSGRDYWGLRGADDFLVGMTHVVSPIIGFRELPTGLESNPPHLFAEYSSIDWFEPLDYLDNGDRLQLTYPADASSATPTAATGMTPAAGGKCMPGRSATCSSSTCLPKTGSTTRCTTAMN